MKEEATDEEAATVGTKDEPNDEKEDEHVQDTLSEELPRNTDVFPPHDSEDTLGPLCR